MFLKIIHLLDIICYNTMLLYETGYFIKIMIK